MFERSLRIAEPFFVARDTGRLVAAAADSVPPWELRSLDLPALHGFVWLSEVYPIPPLELRAMTWSSVLIPSDDRIRPTAKTFAAEPEASNGVLVVFWFEVPTSGVSRPVPIMSNVWRFGEKPTEDGYRDGLGPMETAIGNVSAARYFTAFLAFLQQRLVQRERHHPDRSAGKIAAREKLADREVTIVTLRKTLAPLQETAPTEVNWRNRWWVGPHWRQQACGKSHANRRPTWIMPYLKGPEDKPISVRRRLFKVDR